MSLATRGTTGLTRDTDALLETTLASSILTVKFKQIHFKQSL